MIMHKIELVALGASFELGPCPHCGAIPNMNYVQIYCPKCGAVMPTGWDSGVAGFEGFSLPPMRLLKSAVEAWNKRTQEVQKDD